MHPKRARWLMRGAILDTVSISRPHLVNAFIEDLSELGIPQLCSANNSKYSSVTFLRAEIYSSQKRTYRPQDRLAGF